MSEVLARYDNAARIRVPMSDAFFIVRGIEIHNIKKKKSKPTPKSELPDYCERCGSKEDLTKHHYKSWIVGSNGVATYRRNGKKARLCKDCHKKIEKRINKMLVKETQGEKVGEG